MSTSRQTPVSTTGARSESDVRRIIRDLVLELAPHDDTVSAEDPHLVDDLAYHSLAVLELAFTIEDEFDLEPIDQETAQHIQTVRAVEDYVIDKLRARNAIQPATDSSGAGN